MNGFRKPLCVVLLLVGVALAMSSVVNARQASGASGVSTQKQVHLQRSAKELKPNAPKSTFGRRFQNPQPSFMNKVESCSGSCNCSSCSCTGSFECCLGGCIACWDYRDGQGMCNAT